ncbi:MAG: hypothetical protein WCO35_03115 [Candidatus Nomurabacteria bacterium]
MQMVEAKKTGFTIKSVESLSIFKLIESEDDSPVDRGFLNRFLLRKCNISQRKYLRIKNQYIYESGFPEKEFHHSLLDHLIFDSCVETFSDDFSTQFLILNFMEISKIDDFNEFLDEIVDLNLKWKGIVELTIVDSLFFSFKFI